MIRMIKKIETRFLTGKEIGCVFKVVSYTIFVILVRNLKKETVECVIHFGHMSKLGELFEPFLSTGKVNDRPSKLLRDSGASLDIISAREVEKY